MDIMGVLGPLKRPTSHMIITRVKALSIFLLSQWAKIMALLKTNGQVSPPATTWNDKK